MKDRLSGKECGTAATKDEDEEDEMERSTGEVAGAWEYVSCVL